ncbi:amino acid ABC transporter permease [Acidisoma cellulosilytica]|uniref:Amino acid ABC transporter permease n=2 Tax=Acidisoma cellulosilyticum TaxID=2802395 RepID=A0A963YX84_9PROT|nr:amino acid ABC transporter permease [Acidisoma cellulosilyticum]
MVKAAGVTAVCSVLAIAIGIAIGIVVCGATLARPKPLQIAARLYVSFFRGVPLLVQLLLFYNLLPAVGLNISSFFAAELALSLCTSAYQAETLRGGFLSVSTGLKEAADMVGMTLWQRFRRVEAPIALRLTIPAIVNEAISILHASALVSVIGVVELTKTAGEIAASNYDPLPVYACAGLLYLIMTYVIQLLGLAAERRFPVRSA